MYHTCNLHQVDETIQYFGSFSVYWIYYYIYYMLFELYLLVIWKMPFTMFPSYFQMIWINNLFITEVFSFSVDFMLASSSFILQKTVYNKQIRTNLKLLIKLYLIFQCKQIGSAVYTEKQPSNKIITQQTLRALYG